MRKHHPHAVLLDADQRQRARFLDQLLQAFHPLVALAAGDEIAQAADDLAGAQRLFGRLVHRVAHHARGVIGLSLQQPARAHHVVGDRRQRLVQLMRQRRGHLAHGAEARDVDQLGLQLLQPRLGLLPLAEVADEAGEEAPRRRVHLADGELDREGRAVLALGDDDAADADDPLFAGAQVAAEIAVMLLAIGIRHQPSHVRADHLVRGVAEQPFRRACRTTGSRLVR